MNLFTTLKDLVREGRFAAPGAHKTNHFVWRCLTTFVDDVWQRCLTTFHHFSNDWPLCLTMFEHLVDDLFGGFCRPLLWALPLWTICSFVVWPHLLTIFNHLCWWLLNMCLTMFDHLCWRYLICCWTICDHSCLTILDLMFDNVGRLCLTICLGVLWTSLVGLPFLNQPFPDIYNQIHCHRSG
jgi:hypothetical protein